MNKIQKIIFWLIVAITIFPRFINLDQSPPSLSNDEISIAYDAYSISHTGRDEHNKFLPVAFQSHNTYKAPLYIYLASVTNFFFGNSEFSVRLPSALLGSLTVLLLGWLIYLLSNNRNLSLISSAVLALSPWHIYTSRMALETNIALFFLTLGVSLWFWSINRSKHWIIIPSLISFALSIWSYHTEWLLTPLLVFGLFIFTFKKIKNYKLFAVGVAIFIALCFPIYSNAWIERGTNARANTELITKDPGVNKVLQDKNSSVFSKVSILGRTFLSNYSDYTNPGYLFADGFILTRLLPKEDPYTVGLFLSTLLPFFFWGLIKVKKVFPDSYWFIYFWLLTTPLIPSLTLGGLNIVRNLAFAVPVSIITACGLYDLRNFFKNIYFRAAFILFSLICIGYFAAIYYYHFPQEMAENFQYGYKQSAIFIKDNYSKYDQIIVDPRFGSVNIYIGVPHLYISYFTKIDPSKLSENRDKPGFLAFDKYQIRDINWNSEIVKPKSLYLLPYDNRPTREQMNKLETVLEIKLPNNNTEFILVANI